MAPSSAFVTGPALPLRRATGASVTLVAPRRAAGVAAPRMMADKKGGLFGIKMPSMPFGGDKKASAKADAAAKKPKAAVNQFQANASTAAKKVVEAPKKAAAAVPKVVEKVEESYMALQPGDAGYIDPKVAAARAASSAKSAASSVGSAAKSAAKDTGAAIKAATPTDVKKAAGKAADAVEDAVDTAVKVVKQPGKRGAALLREDLLKSAPERIGVGRQDQTELALPTYGEPGYKYSAYETAKQSSLGISSFSDDANAAAKVGGLEALKKAAVAAKKGATAAQLKAKAVQMEKAVLKAAEKEEKKDVLPSYLLPLPEDSPRKYATWKNY
ncbi:hypothetical protein MMPV_007591 [Pyropia vietnamensis]